MIEVWQTCISAGPKVDTSHLAMQRGRRGTSAEVRPDFQLSSVVHEDVN